MKKLYVIMFLLLTINLFSLSIIKSINDLRSNITIRLVEDNNVKGFMISNIVNKIYFVTNKKNFYYTLRKTKTNHKWDVYVDCYEGETLGISNINYMYIYDSSNDKKHTHFDSEKIKINVVTTYNYETDIIDFIISVPLKGLNSFRFSFFKQIILRK